MGFSKDFLWGAASAAHQIEGAYNEDGKGLGIWDALCEGHIKHNENGNEACDHYHRYKEDIAIMKELGLKSYRFSVSWPRVIPEEGRINEKGLQFYMDLVDELTKAGIEPMCTLFHWNLPMWIYEKGGWKCEQVGEYFNEYTRVVVEALSGKVKYWMTFNEPQCFIGLGYVVGSHAPFLNERETIGILTRNVMIAHGKAVRTIREYAKQKPMIGMALVASCITPTTLDEADIEKARLDTYSDRYSVMGINWWADPMILGVLPNTLRNFITKEELEIIHQPLDFFGFNVYNSMNYNEFFGGSSSRLYPGIPRTTMDWPITPEVLYWASRFHYERYHLSLLITENGMSNNDFVMMDGEVHDPQRTDFIHSYLINLKKTVEEGIPVIGYQYWSILDNYEWAEGYDKRFGLIHVDYRTQKRTIKDSAYFYAEVIKTNGENL
jgi:beta-glucosidase